MNHVCVCVCARLPRSPLRGLWVCVLHKEKAFVASAVSSGVYDAHIPPTGQAQARGRHVSSSASRVLYGSATQ